MLALDYSSVSAAKKRYRVTADEDRKYLRLAACAVIPADAGIQKPDWMPDQVRHDAEYPLLAAG